MKARPKRRRTSRDETRAILAPQVRIMEHVPPGRLAAAGEVLIVCPWLAGLPSDSGLWISALPIHDVNSFGENGLAIAAPAKLRARLYFGVFALDRLRTPDQLFAGLHSKGIQRLINLPSVSFFDSATAQTFDLLDFSFDHEVAFLRRAKLAGFDVALCARRGTLLSSPDIFDFVLLHSGPGRSMELVTSSPASPQA